MGARHSFQSIGRILSVLEHTTTMVTNSQSNLHYFPQFKCSILNQFSLPTFATDGTNIIYSCLLIERSFTPITHYQLTDPSKIIINTLTR